MIASLNVLTWADWLALLAGLLNISSLMPRIRKIWFDARLAASECLIRCTLQATAAGLWSVIGLSKNVSTMAIMCGIVTVLNVTILSLAVRSKLSRMRDILA